MKEPPLRLLLSRKITKSLLHVPCREGEGQRNHLQPRPRVLNPLSRTPWSPLDRPGQEVWEAGFPHRSSQNPGRQAPAETRMHGNDSGLRLCPSQRLGTRSTLTEQSLSPVPPFLILVTCTGQWISLSLYPRQVKIQLDDSCKTHP